jgi:hypothetical protein
LLPSDTYGRVSDGETRHRRQRVSNRRTRETDEECGLGYVSQLFAGPLGLSQPTRLSVPKGKGQSMSGPAQYIYCHIGKGQLYYAGTNMGSPGALGSKSKSKRWQRANRWQRATVTTARRLGVGPKFYTYCYQQDI